MFDELQEQSKLEDKILKHPHVSFVLIRDAKYFCILHPNLIGMNRGGMRQHLRGKAHEIDFDIGNKIRKIENFSEIIKEAEDQELFKPKEEFSETHKKVTMICSHPNRNIAVILAASELEGELRNNVFLFLASVPIEPNKNSNQNKDSIIN